MTYRRKYYAFNGSWWDHLWCKLLDHKWRHCLPMHIWDEIFCARCGEMAKCGNCTNRIKHTEYDYGFVVEIPTVDALYAEHGGES